MKREEMICAVEEHKLIAIMRGVEKERAVPAAQAMYRGGIRCLEVTFNQKSDTRIADTKEIISELKRSFGSRMRIGAGTVMSAAEVQAAYESGAEFILAPNVDISVLEEADRLGLSSVPGALTPSEIVLAYDRGAALVKLFPAGNMGLSYCQAIFAPVNHIPMLAVGGIGLHNLTDYLRAGFTGAGLGSCLTDARLIREERYEELEKLAGQFVEKAREAGG